MPTRGVRDLEHQMPSVAREIGAFVVALVERDVQLVVVEVDRPFQVLDFEEDLFDTNEPHPYLRQ
jgi:hypothetical protein